MNIGFIGTGNMGTILIEALIESRAVIPSSLTITNRTIDKALNIKTIPRHSGCRTAGRSDYGK